MRGQKSEPVTKPTLTLQVKACHAGLSSAFHQADKKKGDYVLVTRLIQFIPVMQSTPNSPSSHNCPFRLLQTKMCCWIQVSFSSQIKILCDLHNLFNTDPHSDPSFTFPLFCQQQNISSLKTDLQPRQMIRQLGQRRDKVKDISDPEGGSLKLSLWCDSEAQQSCGKSVTKWLSKAKMSKV